MKSEPPGDLPAPREREALLAWLAASTQELLKALDEAGPDRGCLTRWGKSQSPRTCDAQLTAGDLRPLPEEVAPSRSTASGELAHAGSDLTDVQGNLADVQGNLADVQGNLAEIAAHVGEIPRRVSEIAARAGLPTHRCLTWH